MIISIDPGIHTGWAIWEPGELKDCGSGMPPMFSGAPFVVVIERPRIYPRSPVPPQDILTLGIQAGEYCGAYRAFGAVVHYYEPSQWKGQTKKNICEKRARRALNEKERALALSRLAEIADGYHNNTWDAIGLGLWYLKRIR